MCLVANDQDRNGLHLQNSWQNFQVFELVCQIKSVKTNFAHSSFFQNSFDFFFLGSLKAIYA